MVSSLEHFILGLTVHHLQHACISTHGKHFNKFLISRQIFQILLHLRHPKPLGIDLKHITVADVKSFITELIFVQGQARCC